MCQEHKSKTFTQSRLKRTSVNALEIGLAGNGLEKSFASHVAAGRVRTTGHAVLGMGTEEGQVKT